MKYLKPLWKIFKYILLGILSFLAVYFLFATILSYFTIAEIPALNQNKNLEIYITSNGIHSEFTVPFKSELYDWSEKISLKDFELRGRKPTFISFGWGEEKFMLETPNWSDLTVYNFCNALFINSASIIQIRLWTGIPKEGKNCQKIKISKQQYQLLITHIEETFQKDKLQNFKLIPVPGYGRKDRFYRAFGDYNLIQTCNSWVNDGLKKIGREASIWSPWDWGIFYHLKTDK